MAGGDHQPRGRQRHAYRRGEANTRGFESSLEALRIGVLGHSSSRGGDRGEVGGACSSRSLCSCLQARQQLGDGRPRVLGVKVSAGL